MHKQWRLRENGGLRRHAQVAHLSLHVSLFAAVLCFFSFFFFWFWLLVVHSNAPPCSYFLWKLQCGTLSSRGLYLVVYSASPLSGSISGLSAASCASNVVVRAGSLIYSAHGEPLGVTHYLDVKATEEVSPSNPTPNENSHHPSASPHNTYIHLLPQHISPISNHVSKSDPFV